MAEVRIHPTAARPNAEVLRRLAMLPTPALSDSMNRLPGAPGVLPLGGPGTAQLVGPAVTVRTRPGDNLVVHKAIDLSSPGDVLVIDAGGDTTRALIGDLISRYALSRGITGVIIDGTARDVDDIAALGLPVFAKAISHLGPYKDGPGEIHGRISLAGMPVDNGDYMVGDGDGVLAIPRRQATEVLEAAEALVERERGIVAAIEAGNWDRSWVDASLSIVWEPAAHAQEAR